MVAKGTSLQHCGGRKPDRRFPFPIEVLHPVSRAYRGSGREGVRLHLDAGRVLSSFATRSSPRASVRRPNGFEDERVVGTGRLAEYLANLFDLDRDRAGAVSDRNVERVAPRRRIEHVGGEEQIAVLQFPGAAWRHRITPRVIDRHRLGHR